MERKYTKQSEAIAIYTMNIILFIKLPGQVLTYYIIYISSQLATYYQEKMG